MALNIDAINELANSHPEILDPAPSILSHEMPDKPDIERAQSHYSEIKSSFWDSIKSIWNKVKSSAGGASLFPFKLSSEAPSSPLLETKYGLRLDICKKTTFEFTLSHPPTGFGKHPPLDRIFPAFEDPSAESLGTVLVPKSIPITPIIYQLFPEWQTTHLWDDNKYEGREITLDVIAYLYPSLYPHYIKWAERWNESSTTEIDKHDDIVPAFANAKDEVAWETEGFLMASFLALQDDVSVVKYRPSNTVYSIKRGKLENALKMFLRDMEDLLENGYDSEYWNRELGTHR